jgi:hypothetical protein
LYSLTTDTYALMKEKDKLKIITLSLNKVRGVVCSGESSSSGIKNK